MYNDQSGQTLRSQGTEKHASKHKHTHVHTNTHPTYTRNTFQNKNSAHLKKMKYTHKPKQRAAEEAYVDIRTTDQRTG